MNFAFHKKIREVGCELCGQFLQSVKKFILILSDL